MLTELLAAGGQACYRACNASAASGARMEPTPDQLMWMLICLTGMSVFFIAAVMDIVQWVEKERARKAGKK